MVPRSQLMAPALLRATCRHGIRPQSSLLARRIPLRRSTHGRKSQSLFHLHTHPRLLGRHSQKILPTRRSTITTHDHLPTHRPLPPPHRNRQRTPIPTPILLLRRNDPLEFHPPRDRIHPLRH